MEIYTKRQNSYEKEKSYITREKNKEAVSANKEYENILSDLKTQIQEFQLKEAIAINKELVGLYWRIGKIIIEKQEKNGWGTKIIEKLAKDIQSAFPGIEGFSRTNIFRMRAFYTAYQTSPPTGGLFKDVPPAILLNIPWRHNSVHRVALIQITENKRLIIVAQLCDN